MEERFVRIRRDAGLSQEEFGAQLGITQTYVWMMEKGQRTPSGRLIKSICEKFNVSEEWLRTGEGEPYARKAREDQLAEAVNRLLSGENPEFKRRLVLVLSTLNESQWTFLEEKLAEIMGDRESAAVPAMAPAKVETEEERMEREAREEADEYYRLRLEEKRAIRNSAVRPDGTLKSSSSYGNAGGGVA